MPSEVPVLLIVDDEVVLLRFLQAVFGPIRWKILTAKDVDAAKEVCLQEHVDVVLSDVKLGKLTGHDLARWLFENYPQVPCILMSGVPGDATVCSQCPKTSGCVILAKPFSPTQVLNVVRDAYLQAQRSP